MPHDHDEAHELHEHGDGHDPHEAHPAQTETRAWVKTAILLGMGVYFAALIVTSSLNNYINLRFAWLAWVAAGIFFALGGYSLYRLMRRENEDDHDHGHDHDHGEVSWGALIVLGVPLMLGALVPSQPLGAEAINGTVNTSVVTGASEITTFTVAPENRNVLDWLRVFNATADFSTLDTQPADVVGFVYTEPGMAADEFMAARFTLSCCVADASAIGLPVVWDETASLNQNDWVRVTGTIEIQSTDGVTRPVLRAESVEVVAQPEHPYLYP
jgi:uncharacterized repeat protein (TIGR03943 family)